MRDHQIRATLLEFLDREFADDPHTLIVSELHVERGASRVDVAVVNGALHGYEIKSDRDTLARLPAQAAAYSRVFDAVTIVAGERHLVHVLKSVPDWWGIAVPRLVARRVELDVLREPRENPAVDAGAVAQLLWRDEALEVLEARELARGLRGKPRRELSAAVAAAVPLDELRELVRERLRGRPGWPAAWP